MTLSNLEELETQITNLGTLSTVNQQIAEFVVHHLREVSLMSATELAEASGVSQASVSRFCIGLSYAGFTEFVRALQDMVREEWQAPDRVHYLQKPATKASDALIQDEITNLQQLPAICESPSTEAMVQFVLRAPRLILAGARASATLIPYAAYFLSKVRDRVEVATPGTNLWTTLASRPQHDTAVLSFVFPRYATALLDWLNDVARWATPIAAVTDRPQSPARTWAHPMVVIPVARASLFDSYAAPLVFINFLMRQAASQTPEIEERLRALEHYETTQHVYHK